VPRQRDVDRRRAPTLEVVANRAGVSRATASRVLTGATNVSPQAREAVLEAAAAVSYMPNLAARALVTRRSDTIAFVVSEPEDRFFDDPFFARSLRGAHAVAAERGQQLVFVVKSGARDMDRFLTFASGGHVDGALLVSLHGRDPLPQRLLELGIPVVLNGRPLIQVDGLPYVDADNRDGARAATAQLLQRGCRVVGTITGPRDMAVGRDRLAGYRDAMRAVGEPVDSRVVVEGDFSLSGGFQAMRRLLKMVPDLDGVFVANDLMAVGAMQAVESVGRRIPGDVAVVGFDDIPLAMMANPPLTTVRQPIEAMGRQMATMLIDRLEGRATEPRVILPTELVRRDSA
jgi:DNA-binding LacI/PurR family transcriptional regulator